MEKIKLNTTKMKEDLVKLKMLMTFNKMYEEASILRAANELVKKLDLHIVELPDAVNFLSQVELGKIKIDWDEKS